MKDELSKLDLDGSLVIGFYGGGNLGDELLLEVLMAFFKGRGYKDVAFYYSNPGYFDVFHRDFDYAICDARKKRKMLLPWLRAKKIVIGGGGLWGMDFNRNILFLSAVLFLSRYLLKKKVYLVGVGYYDSAPFWGRVGAFLAGSASNRIIVRDGESKRNFGSFAAKTVQSRDLAFLLPELDLGAYQTGDDPLAEALALKKKTVFVSVRRFKISDPNDYLEIVLETVEKNPTVDFILATFEPREVDPNFYQSLSERCGRFGNVRYLEFRYNPVSLYLFLKKNRERIIAITPQYHGIALAHLAQVPLMPVAYDNKCRELLREMGYNSPISVFELTQGDVQSFINSNI